MHVDKQNFHQKSERRRVCLLSTKVDSQEMSQEFGWVHVQHEKQTEGIRRPRAVAHT